MGNEAVLVLKTEEPVDWIVLDADQFEKGTIMMISGSSTIGRTATSGSGVYYKFAGIARREKIANDGRTRAALFGGGIFRMKATDNVIPAGDYVMMSGNNLICSMTRDKISGSGLALQGFKVGTALEDFTGSDTHEVWVGR